MTPSFRLIDPRPIDSGKARFLIAGASDFSKFPVSEFKDIASQPVDLMAVPAEVRELRTLMGGTLLLDDDFSAERFEGEMETLQPTIVHIASHAEFHGSASQSYLLTSQGKITIDELAAIVETTKFRKEPLELLTLSACQTAAGDDRAAMGLAGVAISAGARSAVGSLWNIADSATRELIIEFYTQLKTGNVSKAEALRRAQVGLLQQEDFAHPYYWSAFLVINNWL